MPTLGYHPGKQGTTIAAINPHPAEFFICTREVAQQQFGPIPILHGCHCDNHHHEEAQRINQDMPFTPLDLFPGIVAAWSRNRRRFDALTVQTASGRVFMASRSSPHLGAEGVVNALPDPIVTPLAKIMIDALPRRIVFGEHAPLNAAHHHVQKGIDHHAHVHTARASARFCQWD